MQIHHFCGSWSPLKTILVMPNHSTMAANYPWNMFGVGRPQYLSAPQVVLGFVKYYAHVTEPKNQNMAGM